MCKGEEGTGRVGCEVGGHSRASAGSGEDGEDTAARKDVWGRARGGLSGRLALDSRAGLWRCGVALGSAAARACSSGQASGCLHTRVPCIPELTTPPLSLRRPLVRASSEREGAEIEPPSSRAPDPTILFFTRTLVRPESSRHSIPSRQRVLRETVEHACWAVLQTAPDERCSSTSQPQTAGRVRGITSAQGASHVAQQCRRVMEGEGCEGGVEAESSGSKGERGGGGEGVTARRLLAHLPPSPPSLASSRRSCAAAGSGGAERGAWSVREAEERGRSLPSTTPPSRAIPISDCHTPLSLGLLHACPSLYPYAFTGILLCF